MTAIISPNSPCNGCGIKGNKTVVKFAINVDNTASRKYLKVGWRDRKVEEEIAMGSSLILYSLLLVANIANIRLTSADFGFSVIRSFIEAKKVFNVVLITCNTSKTADVNLQKEFSNYYTTIFDGFENITMINNELKTHLSLVVMESCELQLERLFQNVRSIFF